jgi:hypothetical protein
MTDEQINIKIAEACGWSELNVSHMGAVTSAIPPKELYKRDRREIPNYTSDLNAMHEAEKTIKGTPHWNTYETMLARSVSGDNGMFHITASQRALAFISTLSL